MRTALKNHQTVATTPIAWPSESAKKRQVRLRNEQAQMNWNLPEALDPHLMKRCAPLPLELAEARKAIVLSVCCGMFFTASLACNAQTFGDVRVVNEPRNLTQGAPDPAISRWLMT